jgi:hypothetical protein
MEWNNSHVIYNTGIMNFIPPCTNVNTEKSIATQHSDYPNFIANAQQCPTAKQPENCKLAPLMPTVITN